MLMLRSKAHTMEEGAHKYGIGEGKKEPSGDELELKISDELMTSKPYVYGYKCFYECTHMYLGMRICMFVSVYVYLH